MNKILILLLLFSQFLSCSKPINSREFYFNATEFKPSKTYKYQSLNDSSKVELWIISNTNKNEILTVRKNEKGKQIDKLKEVITENGAKLKSYSISFFENDWIDAIKFYPIKDELFKWDLSDKATYSGQFYYDNLYWNLSRIREFVEKTQIKYNNDYYETLVFKDTYKYNVFENQPSKINVSKPFFQNFIQYSYFSYHVGLVKYERFYEDGNKESWKLVEIL
tara:strand:+ start:695 stop:1360 length:666 start_codon:yes stop_codon:yes gene_type:complete